MLKMLDFIREQSVSKFKSLNVLPAVIPIKIKWSAIKNTNSKHEKIINNNKNEWKAVHDEEQYVEINFPTLLRLACLLCIICVMIWKVINCLTFNEIQYISVWYANMRPRDTFSKFIASDNKLGVLVN